ncbi:MAG: hypothetical protein WC319_03645 [Candidatus Paceibacterota bacterium]|jgi:predicted RNase H-like nuclease (RuvC/YqgF family)
MEVKEAIKFLEKEAEENFWHRSKGHVKFAEKDKEIIKLLESLEKENEKLKKENEAYKGMWEAFKEEFGHCNLTYYDAGCPENSLDEPLIGNMKYFKEEYLGGGK